VEAPRRHDVVPRILSSRAGDWAARREDTARRCVRVSQPPSWHWPHVNGYWAIERICRRRRGAGSRQRGGRGGAQGDAPGEGSQRYIEPEWDVSKHKKGREAASHPPLRRARGLRQRIRGANDGERNEAGDIRQGLEWE
jgi:hypothetical protein